jgi:hypothetical protein
MRIAEVKDVAGRGSAFRCVRDRSVGKERAIVSEMGRHDGTRNRIRVCRKFGDVHVGDA